MRATIVEKFLFIVFDMAAQGLCFAFFFPNFAKWTAPAVLLWFLIFLCTGLYRRWFLESRTAHALHILKVLSIAYCFTTAALFGKQIIPLTDLTLYFVSVWFFASTFRLVICSILRQFLNKGWGADCILLLGRTNEAKVFSHLFKDNPQLGKKVIGVVEDTAGGEKSFAGLPILGTYSDLPSLIKKNNVQAIVVAHSSNSEKKINEILYWVAHLPVQVYLVPSLWECAKNFKTSSPMLVHSMELQELFVLNLLPWQATVKRIMDIAVSILLLLLTFPLLLLTAIAIKLDSKGPVFYKQRRIGLYSHPFTIYKLRSMRIDAEKNGPQWAKKNDSRITRVGKIIRKFRIDEIPQLLCVLKGDMSMVGPRPERAVFIEELRKTIPFYASRLKMKPGLTGWAQVRHHYDNDIEDVKIKLGYDIYYLSNASILLDIQILVRTVYVVLTAKGAQ
ncbi:MAG: sugar transferase [Fibromonadaceae bacterium]|nr:sugar transferase [Fibromonadaceae bacterium]